MIKLTSGTAVAKGQLISIQKRTKKPDLATMRPQVELFLFPKFWKN